MPKRKAATSKDEMFCGEFNKNSRRHGEGMLIVTGGEFKDSMYFGKWKDGKRTGNGTYIWADGDRYEGEFL